VNRAFIKKIHKLEQDISSAKTLLQKKEKELQDSRAEGDSKIASLKKTIVELEKKQESDKKITTTITKSLHINPFSTQSLKANLPPAINLKSDFFSLFFFFFFFLFFFSFFQTCSQ